MTVALRIQRKFFLTGQATHTDTINAINAAGIDRYFEKPWQASTLVECIRTLVTEYIFDQGLDYTDYQNELDQQVVSKSETLTLVIYVSRLKSYAPKDAF